MLIGAVRVLLTLHKKAKLNTGPASVCAACVVISAFFRLVVVYDHFGRKNVACDSEGGSAPWNATALGTGAMFFALFYIVAILNLMLMWIDVY